MDTFSLALVLAAAVFHAAWNRLLHETPDRVATMAVAGLIGGALLLPAAVAAPPGRVLPLIVLVTTVRRHTVDHAAAIGFATLTGVAIATYSLIDARAVHQVSPAGYLGPVLALEGLLLGHVAFNAAFLEARALSTGR